jgi:hypothetical protein
MNVCYVYCANQEDLTKDVKKSVDIPFETESNKSNP